MAVIPPEFESLFDPPAEIGPPDPVEVSGPGDGSDFEAELDGFERRHREAREHPLFGVHPDGVGPTLGQDLGKPNPGHDLDWNEVGFNPQT